jgi:hypothetical protein
MQEQSKKLFSASYCDKRDQHFLEWDQLRMSYFDNFDEGFLNKYEKIKKNLMNMFLYL